QIEGEVAGLHGGGRAVLDAAADGVEAGEQLGESEGLDEGVVGPRVEPGDAFLDGAQGGQQDDGGADALAAGAAEDVAGGQGGQQEVEDDGVEAAGEGLVKAALAVAYQDAVVTRLREAVLERPAHDGVILDDEQVHEVRPRTRWRIVYHLRARLAVIDNTS